MANHEIPGGQPRELGASCDREGMGGSPSSLVKINPATGNPYVEGRSRWKQFITDFKLKFPVPGLTANLYGSDILFQYTSHEPIDEADARDAQCRAGYSDTGYGFYGFGAVMRAGSYFATWACQVSCD